MSNQQNCLHFQYLPMGVRTLYTGTLIVLGTGYLFAMIYIFASHAGRDGDPMLSVKDLIIAYSGSKADTRLESALKGPMATMLPESERNVIVAWVRAGVDEQEYDKSIHPIVEKRCDSCHGGSNPHIPTLSDYQGLIAMAEEDHGMDIFTLVRVSHIHLFGITFIFFIVSSIFCHAYMRPLWLKCIVILTPFVAILFDIGSWYLTKIFEPFAWIVMISGGFMGLAFAIMVVVSLYQMWIYRIPQHLVDADGVVS